MSNYAAQADIEVMLKNVNFVEGTNKITPTDVTTLCTEKTAYINSRISSKYATPITDTQMLLVLKIICKLFVSAEIIRTIKEAVGMDSEEKSMVSSWEKRAEDMIEKIRNGETVFEDVTTNKTVNLRMTGTTDSSGNAREPKMTMDMEF
jgi:hypothetical protein